MEQCPVVLIIWVDDRSDPRIVGEPWHSHVPIERTTYPQVFLATRNTNFMFPGKYNLLRLGFDSERDPTAASLGIDYVIAQCVWGLGTVYVLDARMFCEHSHTPHNAYATGVSDVPATIAEAIVAPTRNRNMTRLILASNLSENGGGDDDAHIMEPAPVFLVFAYHYQYADLESECGATMDIMPRPGRTQKPRLLIAPKRLSNLEGVDYTFAITHLSSDVYEIVVMQGATLLHRIVVSNVSLAIRNCIEEYTLPSQSRNAARLVLYSDLSENVARMVAELITNNGD